MQQSIERLLLGAEYEQNDFVFATEFGKPLHGENISRRNFRRIMAAAELGTWEGKRFRPAFRMYDLRHSCATFHSVNFLLDRGGGSSQTWHSPVTREFGT